MEDDSEPDRFDGGSDDTVLRRSNGLTRHDKERSSSLQDLSLMKGRPPKSRQNVNPFSQKARLERTQMHSERRTPGKQEDHIQEDHIVGKVKNYVEHRSQQKKSDVSDRRMKAHDEARFKNQEINGTYIIL